MKHTININGQEQIFTLDYMAKQASGSVLLRIKDTIMLATVSRDEEMVEEDFLPLTVQYIEKSYAAGKIPGGYVKRETKPAEHEILTARIIDRSLRPLFPKGYANPTQIVVMVLSACGEVDMQVMALNAAAIALFTSEVPIIAPVYGIRLGKIDDQIIINPSPKELKRSTLDLLVAGVQNELLMIEMRSLPSQGISKVNLNELSEDEVGDCLFHASRAILDGSINYQMEFSSYAKFNTIIKFKPEFVNKELFDELKADFTPQIELAIQKMAKSERASELAALQEVILSENEALDKDEVEKTLAAIKKEIVRKNILEKGLRADGRALDEVRPISIETNILPKAHGSCLFTRGQTQALAVCTLGSDGDAQMVESLEEKIADTFMFNYNFPGFCVGEPSPLRAPSRRELGHGNLAKRAIAPSLPINGQNTIRLVSEILESNGSSSMASVCAASLALKAAGVKTAKLVAGVAMGLVFEGEKHAILTDIMGLEDHDGDMDFKVAGSKDGITALQMDIKLGGLDTNILKNALMAARKARIHILALMEEAEDAIVVNEAILPKTEIFSVEPSRIVEIIGQGGKQIREIIEKFDVSIDLEREIGEVKITASTGVKALRAKTFIQELMKKAPPMRKGKELRGGDRRVNEKRRTQPKDLSAFKVGMVFEGEVKSVLDFGCFIELAEGVDGLLHASKLKGKPPHAGDKIRVKVRDLNKGKIALELV